MTGEVAVAFLLTIAAACFAVPVTEKDKNFQTVNVKDLETLPLGPSLETCLIPCDPCRDNPICATDGKTYGCPNALTCYKMCGKKIDVAYTGKCKENGSSVPSKKTREYKKKDPLSPPGTSNMSKTEKKRQNPESEMKILE